MRIIIVLIIALTFSTVAVAQAARGPEPQAGTQDRSSPGAQGRDLSLIRVQAKPPAITLQRALSIAEQYVKRNRIKIRPYYLREAKLIYPDAANGVKESYWWFWWVGLNGASGDYVEIGVSMDGKAWRVPSM